VQQLQLFAAFNEGVRAMLWMH